jgi:hypothetical protein
MSYAAATVDFRQVAAYVDRILRGAKPAELPVQLPTKFELVINLRPYCAAIDSAARRRSDRITVHRRARNPQIALERLESTPEFS